MSTKLKAGTSTSGAVLDADTTGILELQSGSTPTTAVTIDTSQNVGIGTSSPSTQLELSAATPVITVNQNTINSDTGIKFKYSGTTVFAQVTGNASTGEMKFISGQSGQNGYYQTFYTGGTERMRIDSSGRPLFNTTSALNAGYMSMLFDGSVYNGFTLKTSYATTGSVYLYFINSAGSVAGYVTQNGTTTVNYVTSSDYRMKDNVKPITNALNTVSLLKPVTYIWKNSDNEIGEGFIAHELAEICPLAVSGEKDAINADGSIKPQGIDTSKLVATLTAAIQELNAKVDAQAAEIKALKGVA